MMRYLRIHDDCWNCNGWRILEKDGEWYWKRSGMMTTNMICLICGHNYDPDEEEDDDSDFR